MKKGNTVYWIDAVNGEQKSGILLERMQVISEATINKEDDLNYVKENLKDVDRWAWDVKGNDGKRYSLDEDKIYTKKINN